MHRFTPILAPALALVVPLFGCARDTGDYPSLAPRAVEKLGFAEPEVKPVELKPDPALDATILQKRRDLDTIDRGFAGASATSAGLVRAAKGQAIGSDAWLEAQTSLAALDDWRAQASSLATDVDALIRDRAATLAPVYPALATLRDDVQAEVDQQGAAIDRLQSALPSA